MNEHPETTATDVVDPRNQHTGELSGPAGPSPPTVAVDPYLVLIERAATDQNFDIAKMERLVELKDKRDAQLARLAFDAAFPAMQAELPEIDKRGRIIIRDKADRETIIQSTPYALWEDTARLIKPILAKHGFYLTFRIDQKTEGRLITKAILAHVGGHREETEFSSPIDSTGSKNNVQGWGSAFSYGKRYTGTAILNLTTRGEDDDGKGAASLDPDLVSDEQAEAIKEALTETGADFGRFCAYWKIEKIGDLPKAKFSEAFALINKAAAARKRQNANN